MAARCSPARSPGRLGGGWHDLVLLPDGVVGIAVGGLPGRGPGAAAVTGQMRAGLRRAPGASPSRAWTTWSG